jgi:hypothetical protein
MNLLEQAKNLNLDKIKGPKLLQVCIGLYQIILYFENSFTLNIDDSLEIIKDNKIVSSWNYKNGNSPIVINYLLEFSIIDFNICENYLELIFENNYSMRIFASNDGLESFHIILGEDYNVFY